MMRADLALDLMAGAEGLARRLGQGATAPQASSGPVEEVTADGRRAVRLRSMADVTAFFKKQRRV